MTPKPNQVRQWIEAWNAHLGDRATPKGLIDAITRKKLGEATELMDKIKREFQQPVICVEEVKSRFINVDVKVDVNCKTQYVFGRPQSLFQASSESGFYSAGSRSSIASSGVYQVLPSQDSTLSIVIEDDDESTTAPPPALPPRPTPGKIKITTQDSPQVSPLQALPLPS